MDHVVVDEGEVSAQHDLIVADEDVTADAEVAADEEVTADEVEASPSDADAPATRRLADGTAVPIAEARQAWAEAARPVLEGVAGTYNATITYGDLAEQVQTDSGIVTTQLMRYWIAKVLGLVTEDCGARGDPLLSALCVRHDGALGGGYGEGVARARGERPDDEELHGAAERLACYERFGATMPNGGGRPTLTKEVAARRDRARNARGEPAIPRATCPTCFMLLPHTGHCDECD